MTSTTSRWTGALHAIGRAGGLADAAAQPGRRFRRRPLGTWWWACSRRSCSRHGESDAGQVVDAAMVDGAAFADDLDLRRSKAGGPDGWRGAACNTPRFRSSYFYDVYECADGRYVSIAAIEGRVSTPNCCGAWRSTPAALPLGRWDRASLAGGEGPARGHLSAPAPTGRVVRACWKGTLDALLPPVLSMDEAPEHPHNRARQGFVTIDGVSQPAPAPRFGLYAAHRADLARGGGRHRPHRGARHLGIGEAEIASARQAGLIT